MNSKHHKTDAKILARRNAANRRNMHLKYIPLKGRRSRSEPTLAKSGENTQCHKTSRNKVKKTSVIANQLTNKHPQLLQKYPDIQKSSSIVSKNPVIKLKTNTKRASMKSKQKVAPCTKKGGFTEKIVSMWHFAKSFFGLSNSNRQNIKKDCIEVQKSKHSLPVKPKRAIYVVKKPFIHHNYKDLKDTKNKIEQIEIGKQITSKDISKKYITVGINTNRTLQYEKLKVDVKAQDHINTEKQVVLKNKLTKGKTVETKFLQHENKSTVNKVDVKNHVVLKNIPKKDVTLKVDNNQSLEYKRNVEANKKEQIETKKTIVKKDKPKKVELQANQPLKYSNKDNVNVRANEKEPLEEEKNVLKDKAKKNTTVDISTNQTLQYENENKTNVKTNEHINAVNQIVINDKSIKDTQIGTNMNQHENKSKVNIKPIEKEIETDKQIVLKEKPIKDITLEINTNRPLHEILTKTNCYKSTLEGTNAKIIIEIKNASSNTPKDNKQMQPQTFNCAIETMDKNAENCDKNVFTLLNTCNVKQSNIAKLITRDVSKVPINNGIKPPTKILKKQPVKKLKKNRKTRDHEYTKRCLRHRRHRSYKRNHHLIEYSHKHGCRYHKLKQTKRRCSTCRGYIYTDDSLQGKAHDNPKNKYDHKERCHICRKRVSCLYHHNKKNHQHNHVTKTIRYKHHKEPNSSKKDPTPMKNRSFHYFQKKKRTLTVCTTSRRNSFKNKTLKRSVPYISAQLKPSTSKILPKEKKSTSYNSIPYAYVNFNRSNSSICRTGSDSDSDRQEATKVLSWWYLHYALNAIQQNPNDEIPTQSDDTEETYPFHMPYGEFCNVYEAVSKVSIDSDDSSINENSNGNFEATTNFPRHPNSFTDEEIMVSENIYPNTSACSSTHHFEDINIYDVDSSTSHESSLPDQEPTNNSGKSKVDL